MFKIFSFAVATVVSTFISQYTVPSVCPITPSGTVWLELSVTLVTALRDVGITEVA